MSIESVIVECQGLAQLYVKAMKAHGRAEVNAVAGVRTAERIAADEAFLRLRLKCMLLEDQGEPQTSARIMDIALRAGSAASLEAQRKALRKEGAAR